MSTWIANYEGNEIRIEKSTFHGEKLFVNNKLQDERQSSFSYNNLTGHVISKGGEKLSIKVNVGGYIKTGCRLFIDDEKIEVTKT